MARFDLYQLSDGKRYVVDVQSDLASAAIRTRVVAPLIPAQEILKPIRDLNPLIRLGDTDYVFVAQSLATLSTVELGACIGSVAHYYDELARALDILFTGF